MTARERCFNIHRLLNQVLEYVSKGVTRDDPLILAFDPDRIAASRTIVFK